jgi:hypothetical protein
VSKLLGGHGAVAGVLEVTHCASGGSDLRGLWGTLDLGERDARLRWVYKVRRAGLELRIYLDY